MTVDPVAVRQFLDRVEAAALDVGLSHPRTNAAQNCLRPGEWYVIAYVDVADSSAGGGVLMREFMFTDPVWSARKVDELVPVLCRRVAESN